MRKLFYRSAILLPAVALVGALCLGLMHVIGARAATCTPTGFVRDAMNLTAAVIDPPGTYTAVLNASPCNIGVYYGPGVHGRVANSEIYGANYFGVVNNGGHVIVTMSFVHDIGDVPFDGDQHGVGIYFAYASGATGSITYNRITRYQKGGITVDGIGDSAQITHNTVIGLGPVDFIAQNGIEIGAGAKGNITNNNVSGNSYTGPGGVSSGGILLFGGSCYGEVLQVKTRITGNTVTNNDVGLFLSNLNADPNNINNCLVVTSPTNLYVSNNTSSSDSVNNTSGEGFGVGGYQAAISDAGDGDRIIDNDTCGVGYTPPLSPPPFLFMIDITFAVNVTVNENSTCGVKSNAVLRTASSQSAGAVHASVIR